MAIFGLLVNNTNRTLVLNNQILNDTELEYSAVSVAQDILEAAKWESYSDLNCSSLLQEFDQTQYRSEVFEANCTITPLPQNTCPSTEQCSRVQINIESPYLLTGSGDRRPISLSMIKTDF